METMSEQQQWTLAAIGFLVATLVVSLYAFGSGLSPAPPEVAAGPVFVLNIALGIFALALVWWGNRWGYASALVFGVVSLINFILGLVDIAQGELPAADLIVTIPFILVALFLLYAAWAGWRA